MKSLFGYYTVILAYIFIMLIRKTTSLIPRYRYLSAKLQSKNKLFATESDYLFGKNPITFESLEIKSELTTSLKEINKEYATLIQTKAIPALLADKDVIISSETGSGKTLAYLIPIFHKCIDNLINNNNKIHDTTTTNSYNDSEEMTTQSSTSSSTLASYPRVLILVPNKDLAIQVVNMGLQISNSLNKQGYNIKIDSLLRNYGSGRWPLLKDCPDILVCTPAIIGT